MNKPLNGNGLPSRAAADPQDVSALVIRRMAVVNAKKEELAIALQGLTSITQQLARTYGEQLTDLEHLRQRVKGLEDSASARGAQRGTSPP